MLSYFYHPKIPGRFRHAVRRNYPQQGASAYAVQSISEAFEAMFVGLPQDEKELFTIHTVLRVPNIAQWAFEHFTSLLECFRHTATSFLNRPYFTEIRKLDANFYVILTMQSWRRGRPLVPAVKEEATREVTTIDVGRKGGLATWVRFHPQIIGSTSFYLSEYLMLFLQRIGVDVAVYQTLDGQELLPYQCAIPREVWHRIQPEFSRAYILQKTAYRRTYGGSSAPGIHDSTEPKFRTQPRHLPAQCRPEILPTSTFWLEVMEISVVVEASLRITIVALRVFFCSIPSFLVNCRAVPASCVHACSLAFAGCKSSRR